MKTTHIDKKLC